MINRMFTGIVEEIGQVREISSGFLVISAKKVFDDLKPGDSVAVNGICLTVTSVGGYKFSVDVMPETIRHSSIGRLHYGDMVNLERAVLANGRFGGHFVQGHVDDIGKVMSVKPEGEAFIVRISVPAKLIPYIVHKGFIAVDGVSLTVVDVDDFSFSVSLVTFSRQNTILGKIRPGDIVNLEVDIIAKYVERLRQGDSKSTTLDFLEEPDFLSTR